MIDATASANKLPNGATVVGMFIGKLLVIKENI